MVRSIGTCGDCAWWCRQGAQIAAAARDPSAPIDRGTCQIDKPEMMKVVGGWFEAVWPVTHVSRFCGGWEPLAGDDPDPGEERPVPETTVLPFERRAA